MEAVAATKAPAPALTPWLRWAGGKRRLAERLVAEIVATNPKLYVEPFLGGGAVALALPRELPKLLADVNPHLIDCWLCMQKIPGAFYAELTLAEEVYGNEDAGYLRAREDFNKLAKNQRPMWSRRSALFVYLNARSFNGLWRTNGGGDFNVPFGKLEHPRRLDVDAIMQYAAALNRCTIRASDFIELFASGDLRVTQRPGTAIYADPPYDETFDGYAKNGFDAEDQQLLSDWLQEATQNGSSIWTTNADTPLIREIYRWAQIEEITEQHSVGATGARRGKRGCLLIRGGGACRS